MLCASPRGFDGDRIRAADAVDGDTGQYRDDQYLDDVALGESIDQCVGNEPQQVVDHRHTARRGGGLDRFTGFIQARRMQAHAGFNDVDQNETNEHRDGADHFKID